MRRRAQLVAETRRRITEAAIRLHTTVGPAATSLSAVAEEAGVTRLTIYRHFSNQDELFAACRSDWRAQNPPPDVTSWVRIPVLEDRLRTALDELYGWYGEHGNELFPIYRDMRTLPVSAQEAMRVEATALVDSLLSGFALDGAGRRRLRAATGHALGFWTWRSLVVEQGLEHREAVELAAQFAQAAIAGSSRPGSGH